MAYRRDALFFRLEEPGQTDCHAGPITRSGHAPQRVEHLAAPRHRPLAAEMMKRIVALCFLSMVTGCALYQYWFDLHGTCPSEIRGDGPSTIPRDTRGTKKTETETENLDKNNGKTIHGSCSSFDLCKGDEVSVTVRFYISTNEEIMVLFTYESFAGATDRRKEIPAKYTEMTALLIKLIIRYDEIIPISCKIRNGGGSIVEPKQQTLVVRHLLKNEYEHKTFVISPLVKATLDGFLDLSCSIGSTEFLFRPDWRMVDTACKECVNQRISNKELSPGTTAVYTNREAENEHDSSIIRTINEHRFNQTMDLLREQLFQDGFKSF